TNLHPDEARARLYSTNYIQDGLIPVCTPVLIENLSAKRMTFTVQNTGRRYTYNFDRRNMREDVQTHVSRYFGPSCAADRIGMLPQADQAGIRDGKVYAGMTREGVVIALGYPPPHANTFEADVWKYWKNRFSTFEVYFVNGIVQGIRE